MLESSNFYVLLPYVVIRVFANVVVPPTIADQSQHQRTLLELKM